MSKVLNFGSLNYDYVYRVESFLKAGETKDSLDLHTFLGGKGLNQSIALSRAGVQVYHAGFVGEDGKEILDFLNMNKVDTSYIHTVEGQSGHTMIQVDAKGENCILLYGGANQKNTKQYVDEVLDNFGNGDYLVLQNEVNCLEYIIDKAYEKEMFIILNPSPYNYKLEKCNLEKVSLLFINEIEGKQLTGEEEICNILEAIQEKYAELKIVLTLGENGVVYCEQEKQWKQPAVAVEVVDTTAAGDTFTGYFISGLIKGLSIEENLRISTKASTLAIGKNGASTSIPFRDEIQSTKSA
ncbi:ribokinase [Lachnospiraceae bacterium ZAX-1]